MSEIRRVVLVGFMGSGKSAVGKRLARRLGWRFVDLDTRIERVEKRSVAAIFEESGEEYFRTVEEREAETALASDAVVLATGGGWGANPERLGALPAGTASVWLRVSPEEAVRRARPMSGKRPLLAGPDPLATARELLDRREASYALAGLEVDTEGRTVEDVAARIVAWLRSELSAHPGLETH